MNNMPENKDCLWCKSKLETGTTKELGEVYFCPIYCNPRAIFFEDCPHQDVGFVKVGTTVRCQCNDCREFIGGFYKKSKFDFDKLPNMKPQRHELKAEIRKRYERKFEQKKQEQALKKEQEQAEYKARYYAYLQSAEWAKKRAYVLERDKFLCQICLSARATQAHHLSYNMVFNEPAFHLTSVCKECHERIHGLSTENP